MSEASTPLNPDEEIVKPPPEDARGGFGGRWGSAGMPLERSGIAIIDLRECLGIEGEWR